MKKVCKVCTNEFDGVHRDVCSWQCDEKRLKTLREELDESVKSDKSHVENLSKGDS